VVNNLLNVLLDPGTFLSWDDDRGRESVITGAGSVAGHRAAIVASDFTVAGGSIGLAAGERLTRAVERATAQRLPLIALPASGGTRMQEGTAAFLQMLRVTTAVTAHKAAGLPYLAYLRHPTTGGVLASWASLAHVTIAEPGALIGFLGPRVYETLEGEPFPAGIQIAEHLHSCGLVDAVVRPEDLAGYFGPILAALAPALAARDASDVWDMGDVRNTSMPADAWESVARTRRPDRLRGADVLQAVSGDLVAIRADGGLLLALARVSGTAVVCAAQDGDGSFGIRGVELFLRGLRMAEELRVPLLTVIDTPGAELSVAAEEAGIAGKLAQCIAAMISLPVPTVAVLLGQGTGAAALALLPADRVLAAGHAWLAPLAPEGASAIVYRDAGHAPELARAQGITAADLVAAGMVDEVVAEGQGLAVAVRAAVADVAGREAGERLAQRARRFRWLGEQ